MKNCSDPSNVQVHSSLVAWKTRPNIPNAHTCSFSLLPFSLLLLLRILFLAEFQSPPNTDCPIFYWTSTFKNISKTKQQQHDYLLLLPDFQPPQIKNLNFFGKIEKSGMATEKALPACRCCSSSRGAGILGRLGQSRCQLPGRLSEKFFYPCFPPWAHRNHPHISYKTSPEHPQIDPDLPQTDPKPPLALGFVTLHDHRWPYLTLLELTLLDLSWPQLTLLYLSGVDLSWSWLISVDLTWLKLTQLTWAALSWWYHGRKIKALIAASSETRIEAVVNQGEFDPR